MTCVLIQLWIGLESVDHMTWKLLEKKMLNFHDKCSYKIEEVVKCNKNRCVIFLPFINSIRH